MTRPALYNRHMRLAEQIANSFFLPGADPEDVRQEARLALWVATGTYQPDRGASFRTYAGIAIRAHLTDQVKAATREKCRAQNEAVHGQQLELLPATDLEAQVVNRETLRDAVGRKPELLAQQQVRDRWAATRRRQRAVA